MAITGILSLSNELLREVLDHIEADPEKLVSPERRAYLSQESFRLPPPAPQPSHSQDISSFRLVCRRFSTLGAIHQFAQVTVRFSDNGFDRLDKIASERHLASHVRKFAYMVPFFYVDNRDNVREVLVGPAAGLGPLDATSFMRKAREQKRIRASERDLKTLEKAFAAFSSLQHVQILRLVDREDSALLEFLRQNTNVDLHVDLKWSSACCHTIKTLAAAMASSQSPCSRFSSPMMSSQSLSEFIDQDPGIYHSLARQITSLELHFDDPIDLDAKMRELSPLFKAFFHIADNIQAIHVGFPSHRPLTIPLESIFHNVKWNKLVALGIQGWKLDAEEIIALAGRYHDRLRGLRLRDILLKEGSRWKTVLAFLRNDMARLHWVSLRRIGYAKSFDEQWSTAGVEVPDDPPGGDSDSDSLASSNREVQVPTDPEHDASRNWAATAESVSDRDSLVHSDDDDDNDDDGDDDDDDEDSDSSSSDDDDDQEDLSADVMDFPRLSPDRPDPILWCTCSTADNRPTADARSADDISDNGVFVSNAQRKTWEKWVVRRCPQHSRPPR